VAGDAVDAAAAGIFENAVLKTQQEAKSAIIAEVRGRTGLAASIVTGVVVWLVTVALTVLLALAEPEWVRNLIAHVDKAG